MVISNDAAFGKIQQCDKIYNMYDKALSEWEISFLKNPIANIALKSKIWNIFPLRSGTRHICSLSITIQQRWIELEVLASSIKARKRN